MSCHFRFSCGFSFKNKQKTVQASIFVYYYVIASRSRDSRRRPGSENKRKRIAATFPQLSTACGKLGRIIVENSGKRPHYCPLFASKTKKIRKIARNRGKKPLNHCPTRRGKLRSVRGRPCGSRGFGQPTLPPRSDPAARPPVCRAAYRGSRRQNPPYMR